MIQLHEYLSASYEPEAEFVDGRLVDRHVGEYRHQSDAGLIAVAFRTS